VPGPPLQVPPNCDLTLGLRCVDKATPGRSVWEMRADERFENPAGLLQGGFLAAMADSAMGAAAVTFAQGRRVHVANAEMKVSFLAPVRAGGILRCDAAVVSGSTRTAFLEASITEQGGRLVARASSTYLYRDRD
jgi:uncharacterized protein (TIGR00369 family)